MGSPVAEAPESVREIASDKGAAIRRQDRNKKIKAVVYPIVTTLVVLGIWEYVSQTDIVDPIVMPPPTEVWKALVDLSGESYFWEAIGITTYETLVGFVLGCAIGFVLGTAIGMIDTVRYALYPLVVAFQNTPRVAFAPVFLTWFGFGLTSKYVMAAAICFFPLLISVVVGLETVDRDARTLMRSFGASRWQTYRKLALPSSLSYVFAGLKQAMTFALIGAVVAEFVGAEKGVGTLINKFNLQLEVASGFAAIIALMIVGLVLYGLMELADSKIVFWRAR
jgi:NitT/TauT family transport system permease protein